MHSKLFHKKSHSHWKYKDSNNCSSFIVKKYNENQNSFQKGLIFFSLFSVSLVFAILRQNLKFSSCCSHLNHAKSNYFGFTNKKASRDADKSMALEKKLFLISPGFSEANVYFLDIDLKWDVLGMVRWNICQLFFIESSLQVVCNDIKQHTNLFIELRSRFGIKLWWYC